MPNDQQQFQTDFKIALANSTAALNHLHCADAVAKATARLRRTREAALECGAAMKRMHESGSFKLAHGNWSALCRALSMSRSNSYRLMELADSIARQAENGDADAAKPATRTDPPPRSAGTAAARAAETPDSIQDSDGPMSLVDLHDLTVVLLDFADTLRQARRVPSNKRVFRPNEIAAFRWIPEQFSSPWIARQYAGMNSGRMTYYAELFRRLEAEFGMRRLAAIDA